MTADTKNSMNDRWPVNHLPSDPARLAFAVTPNDTQDLTNPSGNNTPSYAKALYVGGAGNLAVITAGDGTNSGQGTAVTFLNVPVGWFPVQVRRVMNANTTASDIVALMD
jgi:hypothetical protein